MTKLEIGIIGCGTIGSALAKVIIKEFSRRASLAFLHDLNFQNALHLQRQLKRRIPIVSLDELIEKSDFVIEAASAEISGYIASQVLKKEKQALLMSIGGLLSGSPFKIPAGKTRGQLWIPSGALAGLDALLAAKEGEIDSVRLITRKPPAGLREAPYFRRKKFPRLYGDKEYCLFRGSASDAVKGFPQNINVAAALSLAGIGAEKTKVEIWTSRKFRVNEHAVEIKASSGTIMTRTRNVPSRENPKTSSLAVQSAIAALRKIFSAVHLGT